MNKKKIVLIVIAVALVLAIAGAVYFMCFAPGDFGRAKWGMSIDRVRSVTPGDPIGEDSSSLSYPLTTLQDIELSGTVFYNFDSQTGKLTTISIGCDTSGFEDKKIARLVSAFEEKYGEPEKSEISEIRYDYKWETERTRITIRQLSSYTLIKYGDITIPEE